MVKWFKSYNKYKLFSYRSNIFYQELRLVEYNNNSNLRHCDQVKTHVRRSAAWETGGDSFESTIGGTEELSFIDNVVLYSLLRHINSKLDNITTK